MYFIINRISVFVYWSINLSVLHEDISIYFLLYHNFLLLLYSSIIRNNLNIHFPAYIYQVLHFTKASVFVVLHTQNVFKIIILTFSSHYYFSVALIVITLWRKQWLIYIVIVDRLYSVSICQRYLFQSSTYFSLFLLIFYGMEKLYFSGLNTESIMPPQFCLFTSSLPRQLSRREMSRLPVF